MTVSFVVLLTASALWRDWRHAAAAEARAREFVTFQLAGEQHSVEQLLAAGDTSVVAEEIAQLGAIPEVLVLALVDGQGRVLLSSRAVLEGRLMREALPEFSEALLRQVKGSRHLALDVNAGRTVLRAYQPVILAMEPGNLRPSSVGGLLLAYDMTAARLIARREVVATTLAEIAFALVVLVLVILLMHRWLSLPLTHLQRAVRRISRGDFTAEFEVTGAGELAELSLDLRRMEADLRAAAGDRDRHEAALRASAEGLAITLHSIGDAVLATDAEGRVNRMNPAAERLTGWVLADAIGRSLPEVVRIINTRTREPVEDPVRQVLAHNAIVQLSDETTLIARDGRELQVSDSAAPIRNATGQVVGVVLVFADVTEQYRVREQLASTTEMLEHTGAIAQVGGWELDVRTNHVTWSRETYRIHDVDPSVDPPLDVALNFYPSEARPMMEAALIGAVERGVPFDLELPFITALGRRIWVRSQCSPVLDGGSVIKLVGAFHDITKRRESDELQQALQEQLTQALKMESVGLLAGGVAHDFNNMLGVILGNADLALEEVDAASAAHAGLLEIQQAAVRSAVLTRQLLAFARKQDVRPRLVDLNDTVENALKMMQRLIGENIELQWQPAAALWPVSVDPAQLDQILTNLCVNARAAIADVGSLTVGTGNCVLTAADCANDMEAAPGEYVRLSVADTGHGMSAQTMSHIFEPFFTTKSIGQGTGLGLSMVYGAVRQNRGFIRVTSELAVGSTFEIFLPRHVAMESGDVSARHASVACAVRRGEETILLVEDEPGVLRLTARLLALQGYTVLSAGTPGDALRLAKEHAGDIHLVLTDVVMPEMNGRVLADTLLGLYPYLKRLYMSGHTAEITAQHGVPVDASTPLIEKPFTAAALAAAVRQTLDGGISFPP